MRTRILTAVALVPAVLLAVFLSLPWLLWILLTATAIIGLVEYCRLSGHQPSELVPISLAWFLLLLALDVLYPLNLYPLLLASVLLTIGVGILAKPALTLQPAKLSLLGSFWIIAPLASLSLLAAKFGQTPDTTWNFRSSLLLILLPLWVGDSFAYFVGKSLGKHLLAPSHSPKKTWEGAIANGVTSIAAGFGTSVIIHQKPIVGLVCGLLVAVLGQLGDLFQSGLKRAGNVKDSGNLLPGHGGILDRIDSLLFAALPCTATILLLQG